MDVHACTSCYCEETNFESANAKYKATKRLENVVLQESVKAACYTSERIIISCDLQVNHQAKRCMCHLKMPECRVQRRLYLCVSVFCMCVGADVQG